MTPESYPTTTERAETGEELSAEVGFAKEVIELLESQGQEAYIAGGFCRDLLLGRVAKDVDIATSAKPEQLVGLGMAGVQFRLIEAAEAYPVVQAVREGMSLEIATFRKDTYQELGGDSRRPDQMSLDATLADDAARRDLTINALYFNPLTEQVIDPTGRGIKDIEERRISFVGDPHERILEDRIRILRAVRFKNQLGFEYAPETREALARAGEEVLRIRAKDRIRGELIKMLSLPNRAEALRDLDSLGLLELLLPEFTAGKGVEQPPEYHSEGDVFAHQLLVMLNLPENPSEQLVWAALLHDIGKPHSQTFDEDGRIRFNGHDELGEELARRVMQRMRASTADVEAVAWLVRNHMLIRNLPQMKRSKQVRLVQPQLTNPGLKQEGLVFGLLTLLKADNASSLRPDGSVDQESFRQAEELVTRLSQELVQQKMTAKQAFGIDGRLLMERFGLAAGDKGIRKLGRLVSFLDESLQDRPAISRDELLALADSWWGLEE